MTWPSPPGTVISEGPLSPSAPPRCQQLAAAAARADGVAPLSEDVLLQVQARQRARRPATWCLTPPTARLVGYAHLDAPERRGAGRRR